MVESRMTPAEERDVRAAFERDKWAGEWNSLPTAIDRLLAGRAERAADQVDANPARTEHASDMTAPGCGEGL